MICGTYSTNQKTNRIYEESQNKAYDMNYGRLNNQKYTNKTSDGKIIVGLLTAGILGFYIYKNVIKPAGKLVKSILDLINPEPQEKRTMHEDNRIFDGTVRVLSEKERIALLRDNENIILGPNDYNVRDS